MSKRSYSGKLLLLGEYTIIQGGHALAVPLPLFKAQWQWTTSDKAAERQQKLQEWCDYLMALEQQDQVFCALDLAAFREDLQKGLYFHSDIPTGYGAGSSGALCAGLYDRYGQEKIAPIDLALLSNLKDQLAQLESFFHGSSSGVDPLVCYVDRPLLFSSTTDIHFFEPLESLPEAVSLFLIDTKISRQTAPLVQLFLEKCKDSHYSNRLLAELIPYTEEATHYLKTADSAALLDSFHQISHFQYRYFLPMIPEAYHALWLRGLESDLFKLKLCGAGGGGFILGFTSNYPQLKAQLSDLHLIKL